MRNWAKIHITRAFTCASLTWSPSNHWNPKTLLSSIHSELLNWLQPISSIERFRNKTLSSTPSKVSVLLTLQGIINPYWWDMDSHWIDMWIVLTSTTEYSGIWRSVFTLAWVVLGKISAQLPVLLKLRSPHCQQIHPPPIWLLLRIIRLVCHGCGWRVCAIKALFF